MAPFPSPTAKWHDNTYPTLSPSRPELSAKGKAILITGAGTGIGAETARSFAAAGAARIALLGRREQPLVDTKASIKEKYPGVEVFTVSTDVTKADQVDKAFADFLGNRKLDVVVSNAATNGPLDPVKDVDAEKFMNGVNSNVRGALNVAKAFLHYATPDAVAIETNSSVAHVNFVPGFSSYAVAKLAVYRLWGNVGFANPNLRVYHVQPGIVDTDMNREAGGVKAVGFEDHVSLPATFYVWLASTEAKFLKGKFLWSNWDVDELKARSKEIEETQQLNIDLVGWPFASDDYKFKVTDAASGAWK